MTFKKGNISSMKGKHHTLESKLKNRLAHLGKPAWNKGLRGLNKGHPNYNVEKKGCFTKGHKPKKESIEKQRTKIKQKYKEGAKMGFQKGHPYGFKKGYVPWNYLDGKSKFLGTNPYGDDWDDIRYLVYRRDCFTCQKCGIKKVKLHVHHKIPFRQNGTNELDNLITLCPSCHRKEEIILTKARKFL